MLSSQEGGSLTSLPLGASLSGGSPPPTCWMAFLFISSLSTWWGVCVVRDVQWQKLGEQGQMFRWCYSSIMFPCDCFQTSRPATREFGKQPPPANKFKKNLLINCNHTTQRKALLIILVYTPSFLYVMQIQIILYFSKYSYFFSLNTILQNLSFLYHYSIL